MDIIIPFNICTNNLDKVAEWLSPCLLMTQSWDECLKEQKVVLSSKETFIVCINGLTATFWSSTRWKAKSLSRGGTSPCSSTGCKANSRARLCALNPAAGQEAIHKNWNTGGSLSTPGNTYILWRWLSTGTGYPERLGHLSPLTYSKVVWTLW